MRAWTDLINLRSLPINKLEYDRLKMFELNEAPYRNDDKGKITMKKSSEMHGSGSNKKKGDSGTNQ